jgi:hypothetical protein
VPINEKGDLKEFIEELQTTVEMSDEEIDEIGSSIFDKHLMPYYSELFKAADADDEIILYNEFQWYFYYITKVFDNITVAEDGYGILALFLSNKLELFASSKAHAPKIRFFGKYYPEPMFKHEKVRRVIASTGMEEGSLPGYLAGKLDVIDFFELVNADRCRYEKIALSIFNIEGVDVPCGGTLVLGQPVEKIDIGNSTDEYLLHKRMVFDALRDGARVYFKPHPMQRIDFGCLEGNGVVVLKKDFPIELIEYVGARFDKAVTFASSALDTIRTAKEKVRIAGEGEISASDMRAALAAYIADCRLNVSVFVPAWKPSIVTDVAVEHLIVASDKVDLNIRIATAPKRMKKLAGALAGKYGGRLHANVDIGVIGVRDKEISSIFEQNIRNSRGDDFFIILKDDTPIPQLGRYIVKRLENIGYPMKAQGFVIKRPRARGDLPKPLNMPKEGFRAELSGALYRRESVFKVMDPKDTRGLEACLSKARGKVRLAELCCYEMSSKDRFKALYRKYIRKCMWYNKKWMGKERKPEQ